MNFADQAAWAALVKRLDERIEALEKRVAELEAKRGPGRPPQDKKAA